MATTPRPDGAPEEEGAPVARLAASQLKRMRAIVDAAVTLAEQGGFEGMRLRDVAEASGVSLGTLYKYFRSKEDILLFVLNEENERLEAAMAARPPEGDSPIERVTGFFARATRGFSRRPAFARAVLRAIASGDEQTKVASFHLRTTRLIVAALRGEQPVVDADLSVPFGSARERDIASALEHVWFASLVGWAGGLQTARDVTERIRTTAALLLDG